MSSYDPEGNWHSETEDFYNYHGIGSKYRPQYKSFKANDDVEGNGGGGGATMESLLNSLLSALNGSYTPDFSQFDFSKFGLEDFNPEEPVNFFGKNDNQAFHDKFEQQFKLFKNTKGDGIFRVYGHGNQGMIWNDEEMIRNANDFDKAMSTKNKNWKNVDKYKNPMLFIYACLSATEKNNRVENYSIARKISIKHPNLTVVGFDGYVDYNTHFPGMSRVNAKADMKADYNGMVVIFKNGQVIYRNLYKNYIK